MTGSLIIVFIQFAAVIFLALTGRIIPKNLILIIIESLAILLGIWAMLEMKFRFNIFPQLLKESRLVTSGPFRFIRNPMYSAILIITLVWIIDEFSILRLSVWLILFLDLLWKIKEEEKILKKEFDEYEMYMKKTKRLLSGVY